MHIVPVLLGILFKLNNVYTSTGVIDISDPRHQEIFSGPTQIGEVFFYKYTCQNGGNYSSLFDGSFKFFPIRPNTRLVNIVLGSKNDQFELVQIMYFDVAKDYRLNNLYYRKHEGYWELVDDPVYKAELSKLKNNNISFDIFRPSKKGFKQVKYAKIHGYNSYVTEPGYELDGVFMGNTLVWENDPNYVFRSVDLNDTKFGPDQVRLQFDNYCAQVSQYYNRLGGLWTFDVSKRLLDLRSLYTHGCQRRDDPGGPDSEGHSDQIVHWEEDDLEDFEDGVVTFQAPDLCDMDQDDPVRNVVFQFKFRKKNYNVLYVNHYVSYEVIGYEFSDASGSRVDSITDGDLVIYDFNKEPREYFYDIKFTHVPEHPVVVVALTTLKEVQGACDPEARMCSDAPYERAPTYYKKNGGAWYSIDKKAYVALLNEMLTMGYHLSLKKKYENPPVTPSFTPSTPNLDYGGLEPFTYDLNNPMEAKILQRFVTTEPDLIRLRPKPGHAMNVVIDRNMVLWEQKEDGPGCILIYVYRSDNVLLAHLVIRSESEPHLFFKHNGDCWESVSQAEYEESKREPRGLLGLKFFTRPRQEYDEFEIPADVLEALGPKASGAPPPDASGPSAHAVHHNSPKPPGQPT